MIDLKNQIEALWRNAATRDVVSAESLRLILAAFQSETGTLHQLDRDKQRLHLTAQIGLPPFMLEIVKVIPVGKGIAGETVARGGPVTMCNLQTDTSGVAKPAAKQTGVGGALCVPLWSGNEIVGTLGIGTQRPCEYSAEETRLLEEIGRIIGAQMG